MKIIHIRHSTSIEFMCVKYYEFNPNTRRAVVMLWNDIPDWIYDVLSVEELASDLFMFGDNPNEFSERFVRD